MAAITLVQAQEQLDAYLAASLAIANGNQSYAIKDRQFTKADLGEIRRQIEFWEKRVEELSAGSRGPRVRYVVSA